MDEKDEAETIAREGFPEFRHNQWTVEGEIERFGALAVSAKRAGGWKRVATTVLALSLIVLMAGGTVYGFVSVIIGRNDEPRLPYTTVVPTETDDPVVYIPERPQ